jgi:hypothetical protein
MHPPEKAGLVGWLARWSLNPTTFQRRSRALKPGKLMLKFAKIAQPNPSLPLPLVYAETGPPVMSFFSLQPKDLRKPLSFAWRLGNFSFLDEMLTDIAR